MTMQWQRLLSRKRLGSSQKPSEITARTDFQRDFDRVVFSSAFRRMQDKTQIFPLTKIDYVRTRLTHSLESSSVGRSLGTLVGEQIIARHRLVASEASDFGDICAARLPRPRYRQSAIWPLRRGCDPPLGRDPPPTAAKRVGVLRDSQREDFLNFEGNAQGFRVLTRLQNRDNPGGLQLTAATLAAFTKYPRESCIGSGRFDGVSAKKPGFTAEDREHFEMVAQSVGLIRRDPMLGIWYRHPLAFLVEAADDICYRVTRYRGWLSGRPSEF